jgi:S1-C subfamily serine protease
MRGEVVRQLKNLDLALIKVAGAHVPGLIIGDAGRVALGDKMAVIGSPFGLGSTIHE